MTRFAGNAVSNSVDKMIGEQIIRLLGQRNIPHSTIASRLGVTIAELDACLEGRARFRAQGLFDLSQILDVKVSELFPGE